MRFRIQIVITYLDNGLDCLPQRSCRVRKEKFKIIDREFRKSGCALKSVSARLGLAYQITQLNIERC